MQQEIFNPNNLSHHHLSLLLGRDDVSYSITDELTKMVVYIKSFHLREASNRSTYRLIIKDILNQEPLFKNNFNKVVLGIHNANYTLVPDDFIHQKNLDLFYNFNHLPEEETELYADNLPHTDIHTVYGIDRQLIQLLENIFGEFTLQHALTFLVKQLLEDHKAYGGKRMYIYVEKQHVDMLITAQNKLIFCNSYRYTTPEDLLYFIINAGNKNQFNFTLHECVLLGDIARRDANYQLCNQYISNLSFSHRPIAKKYCSELQQLATQQHYNLFSIY